MQDFIADSKKIMRTTIGTCDGLSMKAAVPGVFVFRCAEIIQPPSGHCCIRSIVGQALDHAVARSTVRTINVGIKITAIVRIE